MKHVEIVYHSGYGHTAALAEAVQKGAARVEGIEVNRQSVDAIDWERLDAADAIILGSPTYMGSVSAPFKAFMDETSGRWFERKWRNKLAAGFTCSASWSGDKLNTLMQMAIFAAQHGMIWVGLDVLPGYNSSQGTPQDINRVGSYLGAMAQANADQGPDVVPPEADRETAALLGERVARATLAWQGL